MTASGPALERPFPLAELLADGLAADPDGAAVITRDETMTWAELDRRSRRLGRHYLALGLVPGDRVATLLPNRTVLVVHHLACLRAGLVSAPLNDHLPPEIDHALSVCRAALLVDHVERDADIAPCEQVGGLRLGHHPLRRPAR